MLEILEGQVLEMKNLFSFRGTVLQNELEKIGKNMEIIINQNGAKQIGNPITATFGIDGNKMDIELLIPIDRKIKDIDKYAFKEKIRIVNAIVAKYKGNQNGLQDAYNELNKYIIEHKLLAITVGYNVTCNADVLNQDNIEVDIYVGISPNVL